MTSALTDLRAVPFARELARFGDRVALVTADPGEVSYRELADRMDAVASQLGDRPRLVLITGAHRVDTVAAYLAALATGHPVLLVPGDRPGSLAATLAAYRPEVVVRDGRVEVQPEAGGYPLHPDLALLLTTSGTTGSAKLVRLSHRNLQSNAEAIAGYLGITPDDRAATTLPMHYCYGLSVIHSHLLRGASLLLTDRSVADDEFWELFRAQRATSFAGVPYTFDLLDRIGFDRLQLPHLRYLTQAGGRLAPERVRRYAQLGRRDGWQLFVMYGQTEATARMAYLPPELAETHPGSIGVAIPGGSFRLAPLPDWPEPDTGELVYSGSNVMLGYAERPADLAAGREIEELRTGDVARHLGGGQYQIVGRRSRFAKLFGLRVDLPRVEEVLAQHGWTAGCTSTEDQLVVAVAAAGVGEPAGVRELVTAECGLPARAVRVHRLAELPRLPNGKPDYPAIRALPPPPSERPATGLVQLFAEVLGRPDVTADDTFVRLGGDSLSYVELSVRLERSLGRLPERWHVTPIRDLPGGPVAGADPDRPAGRWRRWWRVRWLDPGVALRAVAIVLVVGTHAALFGIAGGAHLLLGIAGFNFARFHLTGLARPERVRHLGRSTARLALASITWIALAYLLLTDEYAVSNVFLVHYLFPDPAAAYAWQFWFIETLVYLQLAALALLALPATDRLERRFPFGLPLVLVGLGLVTRYQLVPGELATPLVVPWLFALGWAAGKAATRGQRLLVSVAVLATVPGFFGDWQREAVVVAGLLLVLWVPRVPSWGPVSRVAALLAGSSLFIYLTHWQVYPPLAEVSPPLAVAASLVVGIGYAAVVARVSSRLARFGRTRGRSRREVGVRGDPGAEPRELGLRRPGGLG